MTATPIPRTVAMTVFGDLELSTLRELPAGRAPIATTVVPGDKPGWTERMWQRIAEEVADGRQAYVVCPAIGGEAGASGDGDAPPGGGDRADARRRSVARPAHRRPARTIARRRQGPRHAGLRRGTPGR